jgi:hypothetical protein
VTARAVGSGRRGVGKGDAPRYSLELHSVESRLPSKRNAHMTLPKGSWWPRVYRDVSGTQHVSADYPTLGEPASLLVGFRYIATQYISRVLIYVPWRRRSTRLCGTPALMAQLQREQLASFVREVRIGRTTAGTWVVVFGQDKYLIADLREFESE